MRFACTLLLLLIAATARAELTVFAGIEYFNWQEDTSPTVEETGPLLAGGLIWMQDKDKGILFGYFRASETDPGRNLPGQTVFTCLSHEIGRAHV